MRAGASFLRRVSRDGETSHLSSVAVRLDDTGPKPMALSLTVAADDAGSGNEEIMFPLGACVRLCVGPVEAHSSEAMRNLLTRRSDANPPPPPDGLEHLCLSLLFRGSGGHEPLLPTTALHLLAQSAHQLEDWYMGLQATCDVPVQDRLSLASLRWHMIRWRRPWRDGSI